MNNSQSENPKKDENNGLSFFEPIFSQVEKQFAQNEIFKIGKVSGHWFGGIIDGAVDLIFKRY
ncbi:hypothetical protein [Lentimicrobium sp. S6]|uniref:hypothetical protein n=1 Tax=Lentimicrobium sp. S6 TaxID=2735872 RepID=UPI00155799B0|nr:hypothetical protein [Lentimicrobium sp. S6]NPD46898.1 hypothetical protein [Lentimicrobium sp. S6]